MTTFLVLAGALALLALYTLHRTRRIERDHPPTGEILRVDGVDMHYHRLPTQGRGAALPPLLFIHGASGNGWDQMSAFRPHLEGRAELIFVDRPGLGHSGRAEDHADPMEQARSIAGLLDRLGITQVVVIGHSLGGSVTAALGLLRPDLVRGLVFLAPATHPWPGGVTWYYRVAALPVIGPLFTWTLTLPIAERVAPASMKNVFAPDPAPADYDAAIRLPLLFRPRSFRANARDVAGLKAHVTRQAERYGELTQPTLIFTGDRDTVVWPHIHSDGLERDLPRAQKRLLPGAGHMPHHTHGAELAEAILELAEQVARFEGLHDGAQQNVLQPA
ncbi:alpha/beta fold hydrolase [Roseibium aestuarii]|uniref:Alpha/beta fold hydrolase n=1 Tax=Roseibium aestuarii TaxID=2600299 RepID=A0ABW4K0P4_9HYPH|nr:alpha/beta hydrolase [Roseibium aestuarii]